ncbi:MAG: HlyD family type I secretion periplasmic adaptor subunit [Rhodocyclaceae bacterium]|nr:HlyD family type I secretion periplasmic adaptor subunit [Rhodocyclaceae bacterium]MDY0014182.1 HlyD family type I secretion periplasmic adaptor subunit [Rhodocyclaceae bacterium]
MPGNKLPAGAQGVMRLSSKLSARLRPTLDRAFARWIPPRPDDALDWAVDADWARLQQEPLRARALLRWAALTVGVLVLWAAIAKVDEVTKGEGKVIPSSQLQVVQTVDGGVVEEILVKEGQAVEAGQLLLRIDPTRFVSNLRENRSQYLALTARAARLQALSQSQPFVPPADVLKEAPELVERERVLFESSRAELEAQLSIARQQNSQRLQELNEVQARREQAARGFELVSQELAVTKPLVKSGAVSDVDILRLERDVARLRGERDQASAQIARVQAAIAESNGKIQEVELNFRNQLRNELSETMAKLGSVSEGSAALADRVAKAEVKSPMRGTVKRLLVNTVGGVVQPGKEVMEVVPSDEALLLEARVRPRDIAFLRPGQPAMVKFTAYDFSIYGGLEATVDHIAADSVVDDEGNAFYTVRVRTLKSSLGEGLPIIPGMVAEVDVLTGKKTILSYLLKPVLRAKANALTER